MNKTTTRPPTDITARTGRLPLHAYVSQAAHDEWDDAADAHGLSITAILEALGPRIAGILDRDPTAVADARRVFSARRKRRDS